MSTDQKLELKHSTLDRLVELNKKYRSLNVHDRIEELYHDFDVSDIMLTSSFAATSAMLLKFFSDVKL